MKILIFHPVELPAKQYGGVERVVIWLAKGLQELGHEVWIGALEGSQLPMGVLGLYFSPEKRSAHDLLSRVRAGDLKFDVVHFMAPPEGGVAETAEEDRLFVSLLTVHGNGKPGEKFIKNTVFLSKNHASRHGSDQFVYNGIDPTEITLSKSEDGRPKTALFFSKTSWKVKNVWGAFRIAMKAGVSLRIGGGNRPFLLRMLCYMTPRIFWKGELAGQAKRDFFSSGRLFLFPVLWDEPFGLVLVEAMMAGLPVIASRCGSAPEIVTPDCGLLLLPPRTPKDEGLWVDALQKMYRDAETLFSREKIRESALARFHYKVMAQNYENKYREILAGKKLNLSPPMLIPPMLINEKGC